MRGYTLFSVVVVLFVVIIASALPCRAMFSETTCKQGKIFSTR